ncbi:MAG TPA: hypothetical protein VH107_13485 [Lacipirellulaceae bacterium]|jgi:hypothetical protein|nr:hypothetical protein [Lacipirellulaceae bacterium]
MVNFPGRDRRRRVLKDEVLAASNHHTALRAVSDTSFAADAPRYSDAAGVENHPQVTDFVPRRYRTIITLLVVGLGITSGLAALDYFASAIGQACCVRSVAALEIAAPGSLASWACAVVLLVASAACLLIYSIRRHRIDDFRGRYRVWLGASIACLTMSANSVTGLHQVVADLLTHVTGWSALREGAAWWLLMPGLPIAWLMLRSLYDTRECRFGAALLGVGFATYAAALGVFLGLSPITDSHVASLTAGTALLAGHCFVLASVVAYARFVVLDAQGLIAVPRRATAKKMEKAARQTTGRPLTDLPASKSGASVLAAGGYSRPVIQAAKTPADSSRWVDGSRPEREHYDDEDEDDSSSGSRKVSKSDRKRLRKMKTDGRAA